MIQSTYNISKLSFMCLESFLKISLKTIITSLVMYSFCNEMNEINHLTIALAISGNLTAIIPNAYIDFFDNSESTSVTYLRLNYLNTLQVHLAYLPDYYRRQLEPIFQVSKIYCKMAHQLCNRNFYNRLQKLHHIL